MGVTTSDGVRLHVEQDGPDDAPVTVLFSHGFTANLGEWVLQRAALRERARLVFYDQRGHGRSARGGRRGAPSTSSAETCKPYSRRPARPARSCSSATPWVAWP